MTRPIHFVITPRERMIKQAKLSVQAPERLSSFSPFSLFLPFPFIPSFNANLCAFWSRSCGCLSKLSIRCQLGIVVKKWERVNVTWEAKLASSFEPCLWMIMIQQYIFPVTSMQFSVIYVHHFDLDSHHQSSRYAVILNEFKSYQVVLLPLYSINIFQIFTIRVCLTFSCSLKLQHLGSSFKQYLEYGIDAIDN